MKKLEEFEQLRRYRIFNIAKQKIERKLILHQNGKIFENSKEIKKKKLEQLKIFFDIGVKYKDGTFAIEGDVVDFETGYGVIMNSYGYANLKFRNGGIELCSLAPLSSYKVCGNIFESASRELIACSFDFPVVQELCKHFGVKFPCFTKHKALSQNGE